MVRSVEKTAVERASACSRYVVTLQNRIGGEPGRDLMGRFSVWENLGLGDGQEAGMHAAHVVLASEYAL